MRFNDKRAVTYTPITVQGVELRVKALNWAELTDLQARTANLNDNPHEVIGLFVHLCTDYVQEADGTPIVFTPEAPAEHLPVSFCLELISAVAASASGAVPSAEDAKKK